MSKIVVEEIENAAGANPYSITLSSEQATTSGTSIDFTGIPAGVKHITLLGHSVSGSGTDEFMVQLGDSGGIETSGYLGRYGRISGTSAATEGSTAGLIMFNDAAALLNEIVVQLWLQDATNNTWASAHVITVQSTTIMSWGGGTKALSGTLDRIRLSHINGSDTFDAGAVSIQYQQENNMVDVIEVNVQTGEKITRSYTQKEKDNIAAAQAEAKKNFDALDYKVKRISEYPTIEECVHAILDDDLEALQAKRKAVKEKYPK